jgi:hypothetical protein
MKATYLLTDGMSVIMQQELPVRKDEIDVIQKILRDNNIISVGPLGNLDPYELVTFLQTIHIFNHEIKALVDRNIFSRVIQLASGIEISKQQKDYKVYTIAAALMAYLILGQVQIEPGLALLETNQLLGKEKFNEELSIFRVADNINPQSYIDIALGKKIKIDSYEISEAKSIFIKNNGSFEDVTPVKTLNMWQQNYMSVLKIALLERSEYSNKSKIDYLFDWMEKETFFNAIAAIFAIQYFGPNRKRPLLKSVNTGNIDNLKNNIISTAWDMTYIRSWSSKKVSQNGSEAWILCSNDYALQRIANSLLVNLHEKEAGDKLMQQLFIESWNAKDGDVLFNKYNNAYCATIIDDPYREKLLQERFAKVSSQIKSLEKDLNIQ